MRPRQKTLNRATRLFKASIKIFGRKRATLIAAHLAEDLVPTMKRETAFGVIKFWCPGKIPVSRARTLLTKEPQTIAWIESFQNGDTLWDIGANVGVYSLYAAFKGHRVLAFEPSASNYHLLSRNIEINKKDRQISAYCVAFADTTNLDVLYMGNTQVGAASNSFGEAKDWQDRTFVPCFSQAMLGFSIDDFIKQFHPLFPNHIKIDVDGIEGKIVKGAKDTLSDKRVKSVLVELDIGRKDYCDQVIDVFATSGFRFSNKDRSGNSNKRRGINVYNHIFVRAH